MNFKKTFWMDVVGSLAWVFLCLLSFATDIDYVEHTLLHNVISTLTQLLILVTLVITAFYLYKPNTLLMRNMALFGNYFSAIVSVFYLIAIMFYQLPSLISIDFLIVFTLYCLFILPFVINLKALKAS